MLSTEQHQLQDAHENGQAWYRWGPYLSERQWGTVREDYSPGGTAWDFLPHDQARLVQRLKVRPFFGPRVAMV